MPGLVPGDLAAVTGCDITREPRALVKETMNDEVGGGSAIAIGLLVGLVAAVETSHQAVAAVGSRLLAVEKALHLAAPALFFLLPAKRPEIMQRAEDFGEARQIPF